MNLSWAPSADLTALHARAVLYSTIREFFARRGVMEVDTPVLGQAGISDLHIDCISSNSVDYSGRHYYLRTSPEYAMKRLLAANCGAIYEIAKVFRQGERSARHNPEFTMLEWYRPGWDDDRLMDEVAELLGLVLGSQPVEKLSYRQAFQRALGIDPHQASTPELEQLGHSKLELVASDMSRDDWLHLLVSHCVEPTLGQQGITLLYDYPASQAALARVAEDAQGVPVAKRFEAYFHGMELANGYWELTDAAEQRRRFEQDCALRLAAGKTTPPLDEQLLAALAAGLPDCAGVAMGLDRLLMVQQGLPSIDQVLAFPLERA